jgi:hypothetical protein
MHYHRAMLDDSNIKRPIPFYASYASFLRAVKALKKHGIPPRVNTKALTPLLPKDEPSRIVSGLSSLGWIDDYGRVAGELDRLVRAYGDDAAWKSTLHEIVPKAYAFLPGDWTEITPDELREAFKTYTGRDADAIRQAETFFLCLATEANLPISDIFYRRVGRQIADAKRSVLLDDLEDGRSEISATTPRTISVEVVGSVGDVIHSTNINQSHTSSDHQTSIWAKWIEQILSLITILDDHDMTDKERAAIFTLLSTLQRRGQKDRKANTS